MADRLTSKTPMCADEFDEIGVKRDVVDVAEFPDSEHAANGVRRSGRPDRPAGSELTNSGTMQQRMGRRR